MQVPFLQTLLVPQVVPFSLFTVSHFLMLLHFPCMHDEGFAVGGHCESVVQVVVPPPPPL